MPHKFKYFPLKRDIFYKQIIKHLKIRPRFLLRLRMHKINSFTKYIRIILENKIKMGYNPLPPKKSFNDLFHYFFAIFMHRNGLKGKRMYAVKFI